MKDHSLAIKPQGMIKEQDLDDLIYLQKQLNEKSIVNCDIGFSVTDNLLNGKAHLDANHKDKHFQRLMHLLIKYDLAKLLTQGELSFFAITAKTNCLNIEDIFNEEKQKRRRAEIAEELNIKSLEHVEFILNWKWTPFWGILIAFAAFVVSIRSCSLQEKQLNLPQKVELREKSFDTTKINTKKPP